MVCRMTGFSLMNAAIATAIAAFSNVPYSGRQSSSHAAAFHCIVFWLSAVIGSSSSSSLHCIKSTMTDGNAIGAGVSGRNGTALGLGVDGSDGIGAGTGANTGTAGAGAGSDGTDGTA